MRNRKFQSVGTWLTLLVSVLLLTPIPATGGDVQDDLKARRARLMERLGGDTLFVAFSAPLQVYSRDVEYEYRQDSNLWYLAGTDQEETILVLMPGNSSRREILFISEPNPRREHWNGHLLTKSEARALTGIDTVYYTTEFEPFVTALMNGQPFDTPRQAVATDFDAYLAAVGRGQARVSLLFGRRPAPSAELPAIYEFARRMRDRFVGATMVDATPLVEGLRQVKTPYEQQVLRRSLEISSDAHRAGMQAAVPGAYEYEVEAAIERAYLANGAMSPGYPSIVGSGPNATVLHYNKSSRQMQAGDLLLVDAAANYKGLTGDITRTYPVSGRFTDAQKDIYRVVLDAQAAGMRAVRAGGYPADVEQAVASAVRDGLLRLGLITDASGDQFRVWYTHGVCHFIGMDVHDAGDYKRPFEPGVAFVIEPGVYIREAALELLPDTPENRAFIAAVRPTVQRYRDIGIRVEDSFLLTAQGLVTLSDVPRTIEDIERFMARPAAR